MNLETIFNNLGNIFSVGPQPNSTTKKRTRQELYGDDIGAEEEEQRVHKKQVIGSSTREILAQNLIEDANCENPEKVLQNIKVICDTTLYRTHKDLVVGVINKIASNHLPVENKFQVLRYIFDQNFPTQNIKHIQKAIDEIFIIVKEIIGKMIEEDQEEPLQKFFSSTTRFFSFDGLDDFCFTKCNSTQIAKLLINNGLQIHLIKEEIVATKIDNLDLIEFYAKNGLKKIFKEGSWDIEFVSPDEWIKKKSAIDYRAFPTLTQCLYEFILTQLKYDIKKDFTWSVDSLLRKSMFLFAQAGDDNGIQFLLSQDSGVKDQVRENIKNNIDMYMEQAISYGSSSVVEVLLTLVPLSEFTEEKQKRMTAHACEKGYVEIAKLLSEKGGVCSKEEMTQIQWLQEEELEKQFPAIAKYKIPERALNKEHLNLYGGETTQEIYQREQRKSLLWTLGAMREHLHSSDFSSSFRHLLTALGNRRRRTATLCRHETSQRFGEQRTWMTTVPYGGAYRHYKERLWKAPDAKIFIPSAYYKVQPEYYYDFKLKEKIGPYIQNGYTGFWRKDNPLFSYTAELYGKIVTHDSSDKEGLRILISKFHWLLANNPPFMRGTAAILETVTDAIWLFHGLISQFAEPGKSLDLEALCMNEEDFSQMYPMGKGT